MNKANKERQEQQRKLNNDSKKQGTIKLDELIFYTEIMSKWTDKSKSDKKS